MINNTYIEYQNSEFFNNMGYNDWVWKFKTLPLMKQADVLAILKRLKDK